MKKWRLTAIAGGLLWIILGAATGHNNMLTGQALVYFGKAQRYHVVHVLALLWLSAQPVIYHWVARLWTAGVLLFSGSLYLMSLTELSLRYVVPVGGSCMLLGWLVLFWQVLKENSGG